MSSAARVLLLFAVASFSGIVIAAAQASPVQADDPPYTGIVISDEGGGISRTDEAIVDLDPGSMPGTFVIEEAFERVVWAGSWTSAASRTISIRVTGTTGRPRIDLDALVTVK